jgi:cytoskeletal protein RodZ
MIGVGPALRKARLHRGVTIDEASRDTRIRADLLEALEQEQFDRLLGDVYVRGCLRSYSTYLGLAADKVVSEYTKHLADQTPSTAPPAIVSGEAVSVRRRLDDHRLAVMVAATLILLAAAFGVLSNRRSAPPPAEFASSPAGADAPGSGITVALLASRQVSITITADAGAPQTFSLQPGEGRSFTASEVLKIKLSDGGAVDLTVAGNDLGVPGRRGKPWKKTYSFDANGGTPSPTG